MPVPCPRLLPRILAVLLCAAIVAVGFPDASPAQTAASPASLPTPSAASNPPAEVIPEAISDSDAGDPLRLHLENSAFLVDVPAGSDRQSLAQFLLDSAVQAHLALAEHAEFSLPHRTVIRWCETEPEFLSATGMRGEFVAAAASARLRRIWINGPAWRRSAPAQAQRVLIHEYAHVVVGNLAPRPLPRWAEEGLVMHLAGQWSFEDRLAAAQAQLLGGGLPPLSMLEQGFPSEPVLMRRAYLAAYLAVSMQARRMGAKPGRVDPIIESLGSPAAGPRLVDSMWNPLWREELEAAVRGALGAKVRNWVILLSSGSSFMLICAALFLWAYWRKRQRVALAAQRERQEEPWAESLTERDIRDIYGDPEDDSPPESTPPWESGGEEDEGDEWKRNS